MPVTSHASARPDVDSRLQRTASGWAVGGVSRVERDDSQAARRSIAGTTLLVSAFLVVIVFLPADGRISVPLHDGLHALLGRAAFMLPLALAIVGVLLAIRQLRPEIELPRRRLAGVALLALTVLPIEHLLGGSEQGSGLIGYWLSSSLLGLLGGAATGLLLLLLLGAGILLAFDMKRKRAAVHTHAES